MKRFVNLSPQDSVDLDSTIYKNASQLKKDALLLARENKSYSSATSLLVLSSEEVIKAILVFLHSKNYDVYKLPTAKKFFSDHKIRHHLAQIIEVGNGFFLAMKKWENNRVKRKSLKRGSSLLGKTFVNLIQLAEASQPIIKSKSWVDEIQLFNELKNNGFYVDYLNTIKIPQENITKVHFINTEKTVLRIFRFYKILRILHHPSLVKHMHKAKIKEFHDDLQFLISDALKDFRFNELTR